VIAKPRLPVLGALLLSLAACRQQAAAPAVPAPPAPAPVASAAAADRLPPEGGSLAPDTVKEIPSLEVRTFAGQPWSLAQQRGHWVIVNFWATWCTPCLAEIPELDAFDRKRGDVVVIGLDFEDIQPRDMDAFLKSHPISYPIAPVDVYKGLPDFPIPKGLPMTYVIAPDGKVAKQFLGPVDMHVLEELVTPAKGSAKSS
jgi:thiol-disulfide isomerase/thioredoxin